MAEYLAPLFGTVVAVAGLTAYVRLQPGPRADFVVRALAVLVLAGEVAWWIYAALRGHWSAAADLPFHLSDMTPLVGFAALWWRKRILVEVTYFWALAAGLPALLTPAIGDHFPNFLWWQYYAAHSGVVVAAAVLVVGLGAYPRSGAVFRVLAITLAYTVFVAGVDVMTGGNYMFLRQRPVAPTPLDLLGPWPWYLAGAAIVAVVLFVILDVPFMVARGMIVDRHEPRS